MFKLVIVSVSLCVTLVATLQDQAQEDPMIKLDRLVKELAAKLESKKVQSTRDQVANEVVNQLVKQVVKQVVSQGESQEQPQMYQAPSMSGFSQIFDPSVATNLAKSFLSGDALENFGQQVTSLIANLANVLTSATRTNQNGQESGQQKVLEG